MRWSSFTLLCHSESREVNQKEEGADMMKRILLLMVVAVFALPMISAVDVGAGTGIDVSAEKFVPLVWMCDHRQVCDDLVEPGTIPLPCLVERIENYAFEGEQISWHVLVMDKNGIDKIKDVFMTIGPKQGPGNRVEADCKPDHILAGGEQIDEHCNARILEEHLLVATYNDTMAYYNCTFTVESPNSMDSQYFLTVEADDLDGQSGTMDENEFWFFNPVISLVIDGMIDFGTVRPGATSYSDTITVGNDAELGSGVLMEMFIAGTDFYDPAHSGAKCPTTNQLLLSNDNFKCDQGDGICYFASHASWDTKNVMDPFGPYLADAEGYMEIPHGNLLSQAKEIIGSEKYSTFIFSRNGNILAPGGEMSLTFKLQLPEPCNGDFSEGSIYFWGEAV
jgi:hypothetical protein